ncbi:hypothetical protein ABZ502_17880 [Streptomyces abikoensis]|uniref:hypothetical protein n=1 Tax=Streptomyces abikoensis TaxID=97398 RepID=UPI0033E28956
MTTQHALVHLAPEPGDTARDLVDRVENALWELPGGWEQVRIIRGRYAQYFPLREGADSDHPHLVRAAQFEAIGYAGGPVGLLGLNLRRTQEADRAARLYDVWTQAVAAMPPVRPLASYTADGWSIEAWLAFRQQPQIEIVHTLTHHPISVSDQEALAVMDRDAFVERARAQAVTGDSLLQLDGRWLTNPTWADVQMPDEASTEYHQHVNDYLDNLPHDHLIIGADFIR